MSKGPRRTPESRPRGGALRRALRTWRARVGLGILSLMVLLALFADFIAPYRYDAQDERLSLAPPTRLHFRDGSGFSVRPFAYRTSMETDPATFRRRAIEAASPPYPVRFFVHGASYRLLGLFPSDLHLFGLACPPEEAVVFLFGADRLGRDLFSRTLFGARVSLMVGPVVLLVLFPLAMLMGGISGYYGGRIDQAIQRLCEFAAMVPGLPVLMVVGSTLAGRRTSPSLSFAVVLLALACVSWAGMARVIRGQILSLREQAFVRSARSAGASDARILFFHLLPHASSYLIVAGALLIPGMMLMEASLSFLGIGVREPMTSWGALLSGARSISALEGSPWLLIPGGFIVLTTLAFHLIGDALRDVLDPLSRRGSGR